MKRGRYSEKMEKERENALEMAEKKDETGKKDA